MCAQQQVQVQVQVQVLHRRRRCLLHLPMEQPCSHKRQQRNKLQTQT
jgi:hypothetical protein